MANIKINGKVTIIAENVVFVCSARFFKYSFDILELEKLFSIGDI